MKRNWNLKGLLIATALPTTVHAAPTLTLQANYEEVDGHEVSTSGSIDLELESWMTQEDVQVSDPVMEKTTFVIELFDKYKTHLSKFAKISCESKETLLEPLLREPSIQCVRAPCLPPKPVPQDCSEKKEVGKSLLASLETFDSVPLGDQELWEALDLGKKLARNMTTYAEINHAIADDSTVTRWRSSAVRTAGSFLISAPSHSPLQVTTGGAQDYNHFKKIVESGKVPSPGELSAEGFLSGFNLASSKIECDQLICVEPLVAYHPQSRKLYVQVGIGTEATLETFKRKPINLSVVVDVSGSMGATDGTKQNRLEWAKDAIEKTLDNLRKGDQLSVIAFNEHSRIVVEATEIRGDNSLDDIMAKVSALTPGGSTNVWDGLRDGFTEVTAGFDPRDENRVILISDAQLNAGNTDAKYILDEISRFAKKGIALTAIGLGINFKQEFVHGITAQRGGNYLFAQDGASLEEYFSEFKFLVSPIAFNFNVKTVQNGMNAKLIHSYGIPAPFGETPHELLSVETLFFAGSKGGAMVLVYDLNTIEAMPVEEDKTGEDDEIAFPRITLPYSETDDRGEIINLLKNRWAERIRQSYGEGKVLPPKKIVPRQDRVQGSRSINDDQKASISKTTNLSQKWMTRSPYRIDNLSKRKNEFRTRYRRIER